MLLTFTPREARNADHCETRRVREAGLDRLDDLRLRHLVAGGSCDPGLHDRERTNGMLERSRPVARERRAYAAGRHVVAAVAPVERQPGVRRVPDRNAAALGRGAEGI